MSNLRHQWPFLLILMTFLFLASAVSLVNPLFESTDEIRHYRYIRHLAVRRALPVQGAEPVRSQSHHPPLYYLLSAVASGWVRSEHTPEYEQPANPFWGYRNWAVGVDNKLQYWHSPGENQLFDRDYLPAYIGRCVNVLLGGVTVLLTWCLGRRVWPEEPALAWGTAALVAFNPQFIYLSGAMNNDVIAAAAGAAVLLLCAEVLERGLGWRRVARLGLVFGLALLAKFHLVLLGGIIALALALAAWYGPERRGARLGDGDIQTGAGGLPPAGSRMRQALQRWMGAVGTVSVIAALLAGWWFVRNWWLYDDPTGLTKVNELWAGRPVSGSWWALQQSLPYLWSSLWGRFGYGQIPLPQPIYTGLLVFCLVALGGFAFGRGAGHPRPFFTRAILVLAGTTVLSFAVAVVYYILIQPAGPMGRFLFPALPGFAVVLMEGLSRWPGLGRWFPGAKHPAVLAATVAIGMGALAAVAVAGYLAPAVSYPARVALDAAEHQTAVQFGDVARMMVADIQPAKLMPGEPLFLRVVWEPLRQTDVPYTVYVHLIDEIGVTVAQRDTWPGLGRAPTDVWRVGQPFADTYRVDVPETAYAPGRLEVRLGLYEPAQGRLPVLGPDQAALGDGVTLGRVVLSSRPGDWPNPQNANFGDEIALVGYALEPRLLAAGETFTLTLYWQPLRQPQHDYLVFAQVIDPVWHVWGSQDGAGSGWSPGQALVDVRHITLLPDTPPGSYPVQVGLFHRAVGRLPVIAPEGHHIDERVLLGPIRVHD